MAQLLTFRLTRTDCTQSWGFRLQGGKDFGTPLLIQKVNGGSLAERAGLRVGDALIRVNNVEVAEQRHKDAQDVIIGAGNAFDVTVQRGGHVTWKPSVSPVGSIPSPNSHISVSPVPVTKTSLAATYKPGNRPPHGFNSASKPFSPLLNGGVGHEGENGAVKAIVNKQYNSPVGIYSDESIAETLSAQAEVLAGGVLGVNFKKNEKNYNSEGSEVFKMLREAESETKWPEPVDEPRAEAHEAPVSGAPVPGLRSVSAPRPKSPSADSSLAPGKNICADCERLIVGVFVRIKGKNLHVECFKCATCGTSLKNVGYYSINEKLYCDIHAKMIARQNPPAPNLEPVTEPPQSRPADPTPWKTSPSPSRFSNPSSHAQANRFTSPSQHLNQASTNGDAADAHNHHFGNNSFSSSTSSNNVDTFKTGFFRGPAQPLKSNSILKKGNGGNNVKPPGAFPTTTAAPSSAGLSAPRRGKGVWNPQNASPGARIPLCALCNSQIRGPFVTALGKIWCPEHFLCVNDKCGRSLLDIGFVEEPTGLYCEYCFERYLAPTCSKCSSKIKADCLNAIGKHFHPNCFTCAYCGRLFGNDPFFLEDGLPYCENDWNELFTTKCFACGFPIEAGDRWVEALENNYHSPCFNCTICKTNLEGQSFYAKAGRPYCKMHSR